MTPTRKTTVKTGWGREALAENVFQNGPIATAKDSRPLSSTTPFFKKRKAWRVADGPGKFEASYPSRSGSLAMRTVFVGLAVFAVRLVSVSAARGDLTIHKRSR